VERRAGPPERSSLEVRQFRRVKARVDEGMQAGKAVHALQVPSIVPMKALILGVIRPTLVDVGEGRRDGGMNRGIPRQESR
jgi:hypothetical protein